MKVKTLFKIIFVFCLSVKILSAQDNFQENFLKANQFYKEGKFEEALKLYEKIPNPAPQVNYNLGNCAYKLDKHGYALLYWKRAEKDWGLFDRTELLDNISLLKRTLIKTDKPRSEIFRFFGKLKSYSVSLIRSAPLFMIQILFLLLWLFLFLYLRYLYKRGKKVLIAILFCLIALLGTILVIRYSLDYRNFGVVVSKRATLLSGPGNNFQELGILPEASEVVIQKTSDGFLKIKVNKQIGWTSKKDVEEI